MNFDQPHGCFDIAYKALPGGERGLSVGPARARRYYSEKG
jgi:hypothetical protein